MAALFQEIEFTIQHGATTIHCKQVDMQDRLAFHVTFSSARKPLLVVRAKDFNGSRFWTSMPEGRQKEAEGIGSLIEDYLKALNTNKL